MDVPYLSGCFMFLRTKAIDKAGMFDERFFMYLEDFDFVQLTDPRAWISYQSANLLFRRAEKERPCGISMGCQFPK